MTDDALSEESAEATRPGVSVLCYAVFPWTSNWEMPPYVRRALSGSYYDMFRILVSQFLTDEECTCLKMCCKDALEYMDLLDGPDLHDDDWHYQWSDYGSE